MPESLTLNTTHVRLLQWLRHYPFQRLEDLVVALGTWSGRTTIYTHLKELERARLVEILRGPLCPGKRLYHLAPAGLAWYLVNMQTAASAPDAVALREALASERAALLRMVPRVPAWLTLQTAINGLVSGAANTLTQQGHRARLVQWNWQRDVLYAFTAQGHPMQWFADGVGAFCLRFAPADGDVQECWYRFFLLYLPLTHLHLMRARLDRLLRWREAKERWLAYTQMPPILILATSARQAEWWHEAAERVTHKLGIIPPLGAVASLSSLTSEDREDTSPWAWAWKRLGSQRMGHLRDVFAPNLILAFPTSFPRQRFPSSKTQ